MNRNQNKSLAITMDTTDGDSAFKQKTWNFILILLGKVDHLILIFRICPTYKYNCDQHARQVLICFLLEYKYSSLVTSFFCLCNACDSTMQHNSEVSWQWCFKCKITIWYFKHFENNYNFPVFPSSLNQPNQHSDLTQTLFIDLIMTQIIKMFRPFTHRAFGEL